MRGSFEIERKFLVTGDGWRDGATAERLRQGYLCHGDTATFRVRVANDRACLTIKGPTAGLTRTEDEYPMDVMEAEALLEHVCESGIVDKTRHRLRHADHTWEIDEYHGDNEGLVVAEVELSAEDEDVALPDWVGDEVSHDPRYRNSSLAQLPYRDW